MTRAITFALVIVVSASVTASAASPPEEAVANVATGYCLSDKMGAPLPAGAIDPRAVGMRLTSADRLGRLTRTALRIPTGSGNVYYDYNADYCYVHASGIDRARTIAHLESDLKRRGLRFERAPVRNPKGQAKDGKRYPELVLIINVPVSNPKVPVIAITYDDDPSVLSVGVAVGQ